MFAVIVFEEGNAVQLVPTNWLLDGKSVWWSKLKSSVAYAKAISGGIVPDPNDKRWAVYKSRTICLAGK